MRMGILRSLILAFGFLTILPVPARFTFGADDGRRAVAAYPLVGLVLGLLMAGLFSLLADAPELIRAAMVLLAWLVLTGALHFDGFCDMADAALAPRTHEERRRIAKDPNVGSFALAAGVMLLLIKFALLASLPPDGGWAWLIAIPLLARTWIVVPMALFPVYPESQWGKSAKPRPAGMVVPLLVGIVLAGAGVISAALPPVSMLVLASGGLLAMLGSSGWMYRRLGGLAGDGYGAAVEIGELAMLAMAATILLGSLFPQ